MLNRAHVPGFGTAPVKKAKLQEKMVSLSPDQTAEIEAARTAPQQTLRPTVPALDALLFKAFPILDHGFIRVVDYMGDDTSVVQAARVSYGKGTKKVSEDRNLIRYLMRHWHTTPFEMAEIKIHVKLPIFVARQWIRHRTASVNEYSARYSILDKEFYIPHPDQLATQSKTNRQGRGQLINDDENEKVLALLRGDAEQTYRHYQWLLNENAKGEPEDPGRTGLARELARMNLTLNTYTQWYWKTNLHNLLGFLRLRADAHAQYEIRVYAEKLLDITKLWVPLSFEAFEEYRQGAFTLSRTAKDIIQAAINGEKITQESSGLSAREWTELTAAFRLPS